MDKIDFAAHLAFCFQDDRSKTLTGITDVEEVAPGEIQVTYEDGEIFRLIVQAPEDYEVS